MGQLRARPFLEQLSLCADLVNMAWADPLVEQPSLCADLVNMAWENRRAPRPLSSQRGRRKGQIVLSASPASSSQPLPWLPLKMVCEHMPGGLRRSPRCTRPYGRNPQNRLAGALDVPALLETAPRGDANHPGEHGIPLSDDDVPLLAAVARAKWASGDSLGAVHPPLRPTVAFTKRKFWRRLDGCREIVADIYFDAPVLSARM